ncbi:MAG: toll/interleukin-1 receptor domain-containing protein [Mycolicibacterium sp.]|nr:toll/interleukin-1 receptor domain-containing protein [Mycolicibacterium sp.]
MGKLELESKQADLAWEGGPVVSVFRVNVPDDEQPGRLVAGVHVYAQSVPVGNVKFMMRLGDEETGAGTLAEVVPGPSQHYARFRSAYLCYAAQDRSEVMKRAHLLKAMGIASASDALSLEPGERWERALDRRIDEADLFLLFWSEAAKESKWVRREVKHALESRGPDFIVPVVLETPAPLPWPELAHLHFSPSLAYLV